MRTKGLILEQVELDSRRWDNKVWTGNWEWNISAIAVGVGSKAPEFALEDASGRRVSLADYAGWATVVLVFLRGFG